MKLLLFYMTLCFQLFLFGSKDQTKIQAHRIMTTIPGWCSEEKEKLIVDLVYEYRPNVCVEVGVFAGKSSIPFLMAMKDLKHGKLYAIDHWSNQECIKHFPEATSHYKWWNEVDLNKFYHFFLNLLKQNHLSAYCCPIKQSGENVAIPESSIDILHVDCLGMDSATLPVLKKMIPFLKQDGFLLLNGWASAQESFEFAKQDCWVVKVLDKGQCVLMKKMK